MNKKTIKKALLLTVCAILLVVASVMGTLAYLTSQDTVTNTFTAGKVKITLDEAKVDAYGVKQGETRVDDGNSYILIPGREYTKDPIVRIDASSESSYIFVTIDNGIAAYESGDVATIVQQMTSEPYGWSLVPNLQNGEVVYYKNYVKGQEDKNYEVFSKFTVEKTLDNADMPTAPVTVTVTAYAIQADGFNTADGAWTALKAQLAHNATPGHTVVPQPTTAVQG